MSCRDNAKACPHTTGTYLSYDYGAAIRENRALTDKFDELKRQGLFLRSSPAFRKTDWIGDTSTGIPGVTLNGSAAYVTLLRNPDSGTQFLIARQNDSTSTYVFRLRHMRRILTELTQGQYLLHTHRPLLQRHTHPPTDHRLHRPQRTPEQAHYH